MRGVRDWESCVRRPPGSSLGHSLGLVPATGGAGDVREEALTSQSTSKQPERVCH